MADRENFDEVLRVRALNSGATRLTGTCLRLERYAAGSHVVYRDTASVQEMRLAARLMIGADGARSNVAKTEVTGGDQIPYVIAHHEIIKAPVASNAYDPGRCDVIYDGKILSDFYGGVFPHDEHASVGMGTGMTGST